MGNSTPFEIQGATTGFGDLSDDGNVHFGIVVPAIDPAHLLKL